MGKTARGLRVSMPREDQLSHGRFEQREDDMKGAALADLAFDFNLSTVQLGDGNGDRQAKPHAAVGAGTRLIHTIKAIEDER